MAQRRYPSLTRDDNPENRSLEYVEITGQNHAAGAADFETGQI